jgi:hypothetical protein
MIHIEFFNLYHGMVYMRQYIFNIYVATYVIIIILNNNKDEKRNYTHVTISRYCTPSTIGR